VFVLELEELCLVDVKRKCITVHVVHEFEVLDEGRVDFGQFESLAGHILLRRVLQLVVGGTVVFVVLE